MGDQLILYTNPQSRGRTVRWMLEELAVGYHTEVLEYGEGMKSPEYLALNPMGKVPTLVHGKRVISECAAICSYLAEVFADAGLSPQNDEERANFYRWMFFASGPMESAIVNRSIFGEEAGADKQQMLGYGTYQLALDNLSFALKANPYIAGERFTAADIYIGSKLGFYLEFGIIEKRAEYLEYVGRLSQREAFQRAQALDDALQEAVSEA